MGNEWIFRVPLKIVGLPLHLFCWIIVLINAIFGFSFATFVINGTSISIAPAAAIFLAGNSIIGTIFRRTIFPIPEPDVRCDGCHSSDVQLRKHIVVYYCKDCKKEYKLSSKSEIK